MTVKPYPDEEDKALFYTLQEMNKPLALVVNKIDNDKEEERYWEFLEFGADATFPMSVSHNRYFNDFYAWMEKHIPAPAEEPGLDLMQDEEVDPFAEIVRDINTVHEVEADNKIRVAIIGTGKHR